MSEEKIKAKRQVRDRARKIAIEKIINAIMEQKNIPPERKGEVIQNFFEGKFDNEVIAVEVEENQSVDVVAASFVPGMEQIEEQIRSIMSSLLPKRKKKKVMKVQDAIKVLEEIESEKMLNLDEIIKKALWKVENKGIVFIDEIDKLINPRGHGPDVSGEGVQRDLLPIIEGTTVNTRYGPVRTDLILSIAAWGIPCCFSF